MKWTATLALLLVLAAGAQGAGTARWAPLRNAIPDTPLVDQNGRALHFYSDLVKGHTVAVNFIFTRCTTVCSPLTAIFRQLQKQVPADVRLISISVDPSNDRPAVLKAFAERFQAAPGWSFVTGETADVQALLTALEAFASDKQQHTSLVLIGNEPAGRWTRSDGFSPVASLTATIAEAGAGSTKSELTPLEREGRDIYRNGTATARELRASLRGSGVELPAAAMACTNCHGARGEGTTEAGVQTPPVLWDALARAVTAGRRRPAYEERSFAKAVVHGQRAGGESLLPAMPSYALEATELRALVAYLKKLPRDADRAAGISDATIRVGAVLPRSEAGDAVRAALTASFADANDGGGIYGRRIELVTEDAEEGTVEATRRLLARHDVIALVGSFAPAGLDGDELSRLDALLTTAGVPLIGPVAPQVARAGASIYLLLPSVADQARVLAGHVQSRGFTRIALLHVADAFGDAAAAALEGMVPALDLRFHALDAKTLAARLAAAHPDCVLFFGGAQDLEVVAGAIDGAGLQVPLVTTTASAGRAAFALPPARAVLL
ncbi:MAG: hypothetical protein QOH21_2053, partial [Acidobacteriota bacterium]|nr:hypothetical protein [Acidobacteriota bacterium]